jgi:LPXTG-motif cell wall-anchored protein
VSGWDSLDTALALIAVAMALLALWLFCRRPR